MASTAIGRAKYTNIKLYDTYMFQFEKDYDEFYVEAVTDWFHINWWLSLLIVLCYVSGIFYLQRWMKKRPKFDLRKPLILWSVSLAIFSIVGTIRNVPELFFMLQNYGYQASVCNPSNMFGPTGVWQIVMTLSKIIEFGDTVFIVLRKQPLIFLHWYHHLTVFVYGCFSYADLTGPGRWFVSMNFSVHAIMYSYYALKAARVYVPRYVNILITSSQILQMIVGIISIIMVAYYQHQGEQCSMPKNNMRAGAVMYCSYFVLFAHFFHKSYLKPRASKPHSHENGNGIATTMITTTNNNHEKKTT